MKPTKLDWLLYRLFHWRWNKILAKRLDYFRGFKNHVDDFAKQKYPGLGWTALFDSNDYIWYVVPTDFYRYNNYVPDTNMFELPKMPKIFTKIVENGFNYELFQEEYKAEVLLLELGFEIKKY